MKRLPIVLMITAAILLTPSGGCLKRRDAEPTGANTRVKGKAEVGLASYYGTEGHGGPTASGETFDMYAMTAAHKTLAMDTEVLVTNLENGKSIVVRINDRGPFIEGRIIDLSYAAAEKIDMIEEGVVQVKVEVLK
ncbi:MAG: septal ring lytic transglycosylase RlpA family protein [Candidatus Coatesbacteria bacterium]|nr:MAG: septal ring lytic transglycosylase RlpA family protein [Candidatus Coatesbacteria bacterium]